MVDIIIRKRHKNNGEVVYEYRFEIASVDGKRQWQSKSGFKSVTEARKAGRAALQLYENVGRTIEKDKMSYSDFLDYWIENDCSVDLKTTTLVGYKKRVDNYIKPRLGSYRLKSLTREILQAFLVEMYDLGYSYNTMTVIKGLLTKSLNYAEDHHYIVYTPAVRLKIPKNRIPKVPTRSAPHHFIPQETMQKIFERFPEGHTQYIPLKLGYECGLRIGEAFALCWEDIDFEEKVLCVNRQIQWMQDTGRSKTDKSEHNGSAECGNGYWYFSPPKYNSYRKIELSDALIELLKREKKRQEKCKENYSVYYTNYDVDNALTFDGTAPQYAVGVNRINTKGDGFAIHPICVRENGTLISPRTMQNTTQRIKKEICSEFDFHSLRHTHASMLAEIGTNPKYIQARLGHADIKMTLDVYEHITDGMRSMGRTAINSIYT